MKSLEDILHEYKFLENSENLCLKKVANGRAYTLKGYKAYSELISLLYDISKLVDVDVNEIVERLDQIEYEG